MRKILTALFLVLVLLTVLVACENNDTPQIKDEQTIEISTADELAAIGNYLGEEYKNYKFSLKNDINLSGRTWTPIGDSADKSFRANFNGNGHTISGLTFGGLSTADGYNEISFAYAGLFGYTFNATIENLNLSDIDVSYFGREEYIHTGGLIGYAYGNTVLKNITASDITVHTGTFTKAMFVEHGEDDFTLDIVCDQTQYLGGLVGYSSGNLTLEEVEISFVSIKTLEGTLVPEYERDDYGNYLRNQIGIEIKFDQNTSEYYAENVFAGAIAGFSKGVNAEEISTESVTLDAYGKSVVAGAVFGAIYDGKVNTADYSQNSLGMKITTKGILGGFSGLMDTTTVSDLDADANTLSLAYRSVNLQAVALGGVSGYLNDYSVIKTAVVTGLSIYTQPNINSTGDKNYPVTGGISGTMRNSSILDSTVSGSTYTNEAGNRIVDDKYILSAGIVSTVYGNSIVKNCFASMDAYKGAVVEVYAIDYVNGDGLKMLRFAKENNPLNYIGVFAKVEGTTLVCEFSGVDGEVFATYRYENFEGNINDLESLIPNYYIDGKLVDPFGNAIVNANKTLENFVHITGKATIENLSYSADKVFFVPESDTVEDGVAQYNA